MTSESYPERVTLSDEEVRSVEDAFTMYLHEAGDDAPDGAKSFVSNIWDQYDGDTVIVEFDEEWQWTFFRNALTHFIENDYDDEMGARFETILERVHDN